MAVIDEPVIQFLAEDDPNKSHIQVMDKVPEGDIRALEKCLAQYIGRLRALEDQVSLLQQTVSMLVDNPVIVLGEKNASPV